VQNVRSSGIAQGFSLAVVLAIVGGMSTACGYTLAGRGSFLPDYIKTIGVPGFSNRTTVFNLETLLTQKVRAEFIGRGKYKIVPDQNNVDAILTGEVLNASVVPVGFTNQQIASRYTLTVSARIELRDVRENKVLWENSSLVFRQEYEAQTGVNAQDANAFLNHDANALDRMSSDFARTIVSAILEAF
jgi:hypothetical protein